MADAVPDLLRQIDQSNGTVVLPAGTYELGSLLAVSRTVNIVGDGQGRTILLRTAIAGQINVLAPLVSLSNLTVDSGGFRGAILFNSSSGVLDTVEVKNFTTIGVAVQPRATDTLITRSRFVGTEGVTSMAVWRDAGATDSTSKLTVQRNTFEATGMYATGGAILIQENQVRRAFNPGGGQWCLGNAFSTNSRIEIIGNYIENGPMPMTGGLELGGGHFVVRENIIRNHALGGIGLGHNVVEAVVTDNLVSNSGHNMADRNNPQCRWGIGVAYGASNVLITRNRCLDDQTPKTQTYGVVLIKPPLTPDPRFAPNPMSNVRVVNNSLSGNLNGPVLDETGGNNDVQVYANQ